MSEDPKTLEEALRLRQQHEGEGARQDRARADGADREAVARQRRGEGRLGPAVEAADAEWRERSRLGDLSRLPPFRKSQRRRRWRRSARTRAMACAEGEAVLGRRRSRAASARSTGPVPGWSRRSAGRA